MVVVEEKYGQEMVSWAKVALAHLQTDAWVAQETAKTKKDHARACALAKAVRKHNSK